MDKAKFIVVLVVTALVAIAVGFLVARLQDRPHVQQHDYTITVVACWRRLAAAAGQLTLAGMAALLSYLTLEKRLECLSASFSASGPVTLIKADRISTAISTTFSLTGQIAWVLRRISLGCLAGVYDIVGQVLALLRHAGLSASVGSCLLSWKPAVLRLRTGLVVKFYLEDLTYLARHPFASGAGQEEMISYSSPEIGISLLTREIS